MKREKCKGEKIATGICIATIVGCLIYTIVYIVNINVNYKSENELQTEAEKVDTEYHYPTTNSTPSYSKDFRMEKVKKAIEESGFVAFESGYTFDKCFEKAKTYISSNYYDSITKSHTIVAMSLYDLTLYDVVGYTKSGKSFDVQIYHKDNGEWIVFDAAVE